MPIQVNVAGLTLIKVGTGGGGTLEDLGYTRNGAETTKEAFWLDVPGDENGGDEGPPVEIQFLGEIARVRLELTKYDPLILEKVAARVAGITAGTVSASDVGVLMFNASKSIRLALANSNMPRNFPRAIPRGAIELNRGTKFSTALLEFECHKNGSGVLYNTSLT